MERIAVAGQLREQLDVVQSVVAGGSDHSLEETAHSLARANRDAAAPGPGIELGRELVVAQPLEQSLE